MPDHASARPAPLDDRASALEWPVPQPSVRQGLPVSRGGPAPASRLTAAGPSSHR